MNNTPRARLEAAAREARSSLPALVANPRREERRPAVSPLTERALGHRADEAARPALTGATANALVHAMVRSFNGRSR